MIAALTFAATPARGDASATVATPDLTMNVSIPALVFDGPDAVVLPVTCTYTKLSAKPSLTSGRLELAANQDAAVNGISGTGVVNTNSPINWAGVGLTLRVDPSSVRAARGPLIVTGTLTSTSILGSTFEAAVPQMIVPIVYDTSTLSVPRSRVVKGYVNYWRIWGMATAQTLTHGTLPADGTLTLQIRKPSSTKWVSSMRTSADNFGEYEFRLQPAGKFPKGTRYRVALSDCGWCTDAVTAAGRL